MTSGADTHETSGQIRPDRPGLRTDVDIRQSESEDSSWII